MKSFKTVGVLSALLMTLGVLFFCVPARSAGSLMLYVRNQVYTEPTVRVNNDLYASLPGFLKALRFGWKVDGNVLTILSTVRGGPALTLQSYVLVYRGKHLTVPSRFENGNLWVSVPELAHALGAGFQTNPQLNMAEVYFVSAAAPAAPATVAAVSATATAAPASPSSEASTSPSASTSATPSTTTSTASPGASPSAEAAATPAPTPHPDVVVTRKQVTPDPSNGRLVVTLDVENPADVAAKDVNVHVDVVSGEGTPVFSQNVYIGAMTPHQTVTKTFDGAHPDGTSMPRSLYRADAIATFAR